jgi:hypothetical protein
MPQETATKKAVDLQVGDKIRERGIVYVVTEVAPYGSYNHSLVVVGKTESGSVDSFVAPKSHPFDLA